MTLFPPTSREETLQGTVESLVYQSQDGSFSVVRVQLERDGSEATMIGDLGVVSPGESLRFRGRFTEHPVHGRRFQVSSFTPVLPQSTQGITRYLGSGLIPGIGKGLAERLVQQFGDRALDIIATQSGRLREVPGIGRQRAQAIAQAVRERRDETELMSYLHGLGLGPALARRIRKRYGERTVQVIREDPYRWPSRCRASASRPRTRWGAPAGSPSTIRAAPPGPCCTCWRPRPRTETCSAPAISSRRPPQRSRCPRSASRKRSPRSRPATW
jgi:exodeoxyribonuclease V alpha subunit